MVLLVRHRFQCIYLSHVLAFKEESMIILSMICLGIAAAAYGICECIDHHEGIAWSKKKDGFWGEYSYMRKYKLGAKIATDERPIPAPNNWYYRLAKVKYKERFLFSTTVLVFLTDGFHLMQFIFIKFLLLSILCYAGGTSLNLVNYLIYWAIWCVCFNSTYVGLRKKI
jgi:hypothetical protein